MARGQIITKEKVLEVRAAQAKFPTMTQDELSKFVGLSKASVGRILAGDYDHVAEDIKNERALNNQQLAEISEKLDNLSNIARDIDDLKTNIADLTDLVHVFVLMWKQQFITNKAQNDMWDKAINNADTTFSNSRIFGYDFTQTDKSSDEDVDGKE